MAHPFCERDGGPVCGSANLLLCDMGHTREELIYLATWVFLEFRFRRGS